MTDCTKCKYAEWQRTKNGRLHPSKEGLCKWKSPPFAIPAAKNWGGSIVLINGRINRNAPFTDCPTWEGK